MAKRKKQNSYKILGFFKVEKVRIQKTIIYVVKLLNI